MSDNSGALRTFGGSLLFVYGTLKSGGRLNHHMTKIGAILLIKEYYMKDSRLINTGNGYPAITYSVSDCVIGEIWAVPKEGFDTLDKVEGVPYLFERKKLDLHLAEDYDYNTYIEGYMYSSNKWDHIQSPELMDKDGVYEWNL